MLAGMLHSGERVVREDGTPATVVTVAVRPGAANYYNLTVSVLHTYAVSAGKYVVHNCGDRVRAAAKKMNNAVRDHLKPSDLKGAWRDVHGDPVPDPNDPAGGFYDHLDEVMNARDSLVKAANVFKDALADSRTAAEDIPLIQRMLSYASTTADAVESIISADRWTPRTYIAPFR